MRNHDVSKFRISGGFVLTLKVAVPSDLDGAIRKSENWLTPHEPFRHSCTVIIPLKRVKSGLSFSVANSIVVGRRTIAMPLSVPVSFILQSKSNNFSAKDVFVNKKSLFCPKYWIKKSLG